MEKNYKGGETMVIIILIFIILNIVEKLIYYNNGKFGSGQNIGVYLTLPKLKNIFILLSIMSIFAVAQGFLILFFMKLYNSS